jgi:hypothetical protein
MAKKFLTGLQLLNLTSDPATGIEGELYYNTQDDVIKIYSNGSWSKLINEQNIITTASAAAYASASAYVNGQINSLTTSDIEEGSNLYYTNLRSLNTASTAFVHGNHNNIAASFNPANNQIVLSASVTSGAAIANTDLSQPNANSNTGLLYFNPNDFTFSIAYGGQWIKLAGVQDSGSGLSFFNGGNSSTTIFDQVFNGGIASSTYDSYLLGGTS